MKHEEKEREIKSPADNERFCVIAAVSPQIKQWKLASYYPAGSSVEAATTQSRHHVVCNAWATVQFDKFIKCFFLLIQNKSVILNFELI